MSQAIYSRRATLLQGFIVSLLFILIGAVAGAFCLDFYAARKHVLDHGLRTEATVVKLIRDDYHPGSRATSYTPVVSFTDAQGKSRQITHHLGDSDFYELKPGTRIQIRVGIISLPDKLEFGEPQASGNLSPRATES